MDGYGHLFDRNGLPCGPPQDPKYARNKNVLVIGGSGSGKTANLSQNLMQMHSSYGSHQKAPSWWSAARCSSAARPSWARAANARTKVIYEPYQIKVLNTINFKKSMHYDTEATSNQRRTS